jgi:hypothetical protein
MPPAEKPFSGYAHGGRIALVPKPGGGKQNSIIVRQRRGPGSGRGRSH